ncbi:hypothetical protein CGCVW01_v002549 [Colletotrichum viniferum]|nr:hypothetical protein CGCVW01_v002549 [Colletotrichum viniferum]
MFEDKNNPSNEDFIRRSLCSAIVVGNDVYIEGGEVSFLVKGTENYRKTIRRGQDWSTVNFTLSIGLEQPWDTSDVQIRSDNMEKPKEAPRLMGQAVWSDNNNNAGAFFVWGGEASYDDDVIPSKVWRLQADGVGRGYWEHALVSNQKDFTKIKRPMGGAFAQIGNIGYYVGGWATSKTDRSVDRPRNEYLALPGLVTYDIPG